MLFNRRNLPPLFFSQILLGLFIFMFCVLHGPAFSRYTSLIGYLSVPVLYWEIWRSGRLIQVPRNILPIVPFALFVLLCIAVIPLIPYAAPRAKSVFTGFILLTSVFLSARMQANSRIIQYAFVAIIFGICAIIFLDPSVSARADERLRVSASFLGADAEGLNASNISVYFGFAMFMAVGIMLHLRNARQLKLFGKLIQLGLWLSLALASAVIVVYTGSRQGLVWVIIVAGFLGIVIFRKNLGVAIFAAGALMLVGGLAFATLGKNTLLYERIFLVVNSEARMLQGEKSFYGRIEMIQAALNMWQKSPIWGNGNEAFRVEYGKYSHNNYAELLSNYGILGFGLFYLAFVILCIKLLPLLRSNIPIFKNEALWVLFCIMALLLSNLFMPSYYNRPAMAFIAFVLGKGWFLIDANQRNLGQQPMRRY